MIQREAHFSRANDRLSGSTDRFLRNERSWAGDLLSEWSRSHENRRGSHIWSGELPNQSSAAYR